MRGDSLNGVSAFVQMLRDASDMELAQVGTQLRVRIVNQSGHKLPTGYPEGRRMWVNVRFLDANGTVIAERGAYDQGTATLNATDTKVYEANDGLDQPLAAATGLQAGPTFRVALANTRFKDNRIPPRGFANAAFTADGCAPVGYTYADGQYWDDTLFELPPGTRSAVATLWYQTSSREYMEFLRDNAVSDCSGPHVYDLWARFGKSAPVDMDSATIPIVPSIMGDLNNDGVVNGADLGLLLSGWGHPGL